MVDANIDLERLSDDAFNALATSVEERREHIRLAQKANRTEKERQEVLNDLDAANYSTQRARVAFLLNMYPDTRDSDIKLTLTYWKVFQPDLYTSGSVPPYLLFKLERLTTIARLRAKIQNDYGLFRGTAEVQRKRRQIEESVREDIAADKPTTRKVQVFVDETGKTGEYAILGSVWFLDPAHAVFFQNEVSKLASNANIRGEFHFAECKRSHLEHYRAFIDLVGRHRAYMSFKAIVVRRSGMSRKSDDTIKELFPLLLVKGFAQEVETSRLTLPRSLVVTVDKGGCADAIDRDKLATEISSRISSRWGAENIVERISETESKSSAAIQLADLFSGAINRRLNPVGEQRNHKDELADYVITSLSPEVDELGDGDAFTVMQIE